MGILSRIFKTDSSSSDDISAHEDDLELDSFKSPEEATLSECGVAESRSLGGGVNGTVFIELSGDGEAVFKPQDGDVQLSLAWIPDLTKDRVKTSHKRERAAHLVDEALGFDIVPTTVVRTIGDQIGSLQRFVPDSRVLRELNLQEIEAQAVQQQLLVIWIFDYIIRNGDRHGGNIIIDAGGKVHAIDNGFSFLPDTWIRTYGDFLEEEIPQHILEALERIVSSPEAIKELEDMLSQLLAGDEARDCIERIKKIYSFIKGDRRISHSEISGIE